MYRLLGGLVIINVITFFLFIWDKWRASLHQRRVSEQTLLCFVAGGGVIGAFIAMSCVRHKTTKPSFQRKLAGAVLICVSWMIGVSMIF